MSKVALLLAGTVALFAIAPSANAAPPDQSAQQERRVVLKPNDSSDGYGFHRTPSTRRNYQTDPPDKHRFDYLQGVAPALIRSGPCGGNKVC